jgi:Mrp family chromosome partitioning ATPase
VLGGEPAATTAPVLFRVPDAAPASSAVVTQPMAEVTAALRQEQPKAGKSDPLAIVDSIEASLRDVEPATQAHPGSSAPPKERPQPAPGERELLTLLADQQQSAPLRKLLQAAIHDTQHIATPVIMLVGVDNGDQTATLAAALALLLAEKGPRAILAIEADPEQKRLSALFGRADTVGLSELLSGRAERGEAVVTTSQQRLDLLVFGQASSSQSQLLPEGMLVEIESLRSQFGGIVIDAGSLSSNWARASSLAADAVYLLVRLGETAAESAAASVNRFRASGGKLTGCIAIGSDATISG